MIFSIIANLLGKLNNIILIICIVLIILTGIIFDIIGTAALSCNLKVLHSKASQKLKGAKQAVNLAKNASSVSNFCNDVIGDICGIVSGAAATTIAVSISNSLNWNLLWVNLVIAAIVASLTIGGKAIGKSFAINKSDIILYEFSKIVSIFYKG